MLARGLAVAAAVAVFDQLGKAAVLRHFDVGGCPLPYQPPHQSIAWFLNLVLACNRGVSFGIFNDSPRLNLVFVLVAAIIVAVLVYWLRRVTSRFLAIAIGLIIGGALGNVIDRIRLGAVVDFLDFHIGYWHWPAFNLADSAICIGVAAMLLDGLLVRREAH
jgi:signal peptidase II